MESVKQPFVPENAVFVNGVYRTNENGLAVAFVKLSNGQVAKIKEGTGKDVERATMLSNGDQSKYFSALMAGVTEIDGGGVVMEDLAALKMKDYMAIQIPFAEINF